ncbi:MAG: hypothetical protein Q7S65_00915 [Nanoarchaeota archaeon]|nr:hypothetical protein [Nanoarchaeota archaeon]
MITLPTFKGYTIDERLGEFRRADVERQELEFIPFESDKGMELLREWILYLANLQ